MKFINGEVRWGIIGCGDVCEIKSGPAFSRVANSRLAAVMRRDKEKAKNFAKRHNVPKFYTDAQQLIDDPEINAVYIATPPAQHEEYTLAAIKAGKPAYIEKPLTINAGSCQRMIDASIHYQIPTTGAYYRRALPLFTKVKSLLEEKKIGNVRMVTINLYQSPTKNIITKTEDNWRVNPVLSGGGYFHDLAPHQLDLMYWYFGKPNSVRGQSFNQENKYNAPDLTNLEAIFKDNIFFSGTWSFNVHESAVEDTCQIIGDMGLIKFSFFQLKNLEVLTSVENESLTFTNPINIQQPMIEKVVRYFKGESENPCSLEETLVSMKMLDSTLE